MRKGEKNIMKKFTKVYEHDEGSNKRGQDMKKKVILIYFAVERKVLVRVFTLFDKYSGLLESKKEKQQFPVQPKQNTHQHFNIPKHSTQTLTLHTE